MLTELETKIIASIQDDIPATKRPYLEIAQKLEITEETLLATLRNLTDKGVIRRFGATIRHQQSGFASNAMVAWQVAENRIDEVGEKLAMFREVSHCYRRNPHKAWPYNLYTMVHAGDEAACLKIVRRLAAETSLDTYTVLFSRQELKKTSMNYMPTDDDD